MREERERRKRGGGKQEQAVECLVLYYEVFFVLCFFVFDGVCGYEDGEESFVGEVLERVDAGEE